MKKFPGLMTSLSPHWATPKALYEQLDGEFHFTFDPCPLRCGVVWDGLKQPWGKVNFINPPYGRKIGEWIKKGFEESRGGGYVCFLITKPNRYALVA